MVQFTRIGPKIWIIDDACAIALEMCVVDRVKSEQCGHKPPVGLRHFVADEVPRPGQPYFQPIERREQF